MNTIEVGQTWEMIDQDGGAMRVVIDEVGELDVLTHRVRNGKPHTFRRRVLERGLRRARVVLDAAGSPVEREIVTPRKVMGHAPKYALRKATPQMATAYDMLVNQHLPTAAIASRFGISRTTASTWISTWRAHLSRAAAVDVPIAVGE